MKKSSVYFAELVGANIVKIGYTRRTVKWRVSKIRTKSENAGPLVVLGAMRGDRAVEQKIHRVLAHYRKHGEWFWLKPEVRRFIDTCIEKNDVEMARAIHSDIISAESESENHRLYEWACYEERGLC